MEPTAMRRSPHGAYAFLALAASLITLHFVLPTGSLPQALTYLSVGFAAFLAVVTGIVLHRPERTIHLWLFAAGLALLSLGDAIWNVYDYVLEIERPFPSVADWAYLAGYGAFIGAMLMLLRSRQRPNLSDLLDGAIVLNGGAILLWFALMKPVASDASMSVGARIVSTAYPAADVLLLVVLAQLIMTAGARSFAFRAIVVGAIVLFVADVLYGLGTLDGTYVDGGWLDAGWMISTALWGAAVLHPSVRTMHEHAPLRAARLTCWRFVLLTTAALVTPLVILLYGEGSGFDSGLIATGAAATTLLIFGRMALLFREHSRAVVALRDAETRQTVEETLRVANERFQSAARALECATYEWDPERDEILWGDGLSVAFGHSAALVDSSNSWFLEHVHPDDLDHVSATLGRVRSGETSGQSNYRFCAGDGAYRDVLDRWVVRTNADGSVAGLIGGIVDVTHSKELERQLQQAQKMEAVGRLAGGVAHDFNNLLMAIAGNAELLAESPTLTASERADLVEILRAADRATGLTRQLLTFSRKDGVGPAAVQLNEAVGEAVTMLQRLLGSEVSVVTALGDDVGAVASDMTGIEQIVLNLAVNGRDAMPAGGVLRISTSVVDESAVLTVEDSGTGMDDDTVQHAFEPFFTTKEVGQGTGLGLATVYGIVERAGGTIDVTSAVGIGTCFRICLPQVDAPTTNEPTGVDVGIQGSASILLVDDDTAVRTLVARMLTAHGYGVLESSGPEEAIARFADASFNPALVVSDLIMPGMRGRALAERIGELRPGLRFLFISGYSEDGPQMRGSHSLLMKPFTSAELTQAVREVLDAGPLEPLPV